MPPPQRTPTAISPELVLVDPSLARLALGEQVGHHASPASGLRVVERDLRETVLRISQLSDVNPPDRRRRVLSFSGVVTLWVEAFVAIAAHLQLGGVL